MSTDRDTLVLLAMERLAAPGEPRWTAEEVAVRAGIDPILANRFWRALGFADVPPDAEPAFTDADVEALTIASANLESGATTVETALQLTRTIASSVARVAEAQVALALDRGDRLPVSSPLELQAKPLLDTPRLLEFMWRRHLHAATRRALLRHTDDHVGEEVAVGFADLVGFTALSQQLGEQELAAVVDHFSVLAHDRVVALGGRVVKMIGDEVMFTVDDVAAGAELALGLAEAYAGEAELSDVRVSLAWGPVLFREGDVFGPVVNLASRIVGIARPASVIVGPEVHGLLADAHGLRWRPMRPRWLKGIGRVQLWVLRRAAA